jgi:hypothetical protein
MPVSYNFFESNQFINVDICWCLSVTAYSPNICGQRVTDVPYGAHLGRILYAIIRLKCLTVSQTLDFLGTQSIPLLKSFIKLT